MIDITARDKYGQIWGDIILHNILLNSGLSSFKNLSDNSKIELILADSVIQKTINESGDLFRIVNSYDRVAYGQVFLNPMNLEIYEIHIIKKFRFRERIKDYLIIVESINETASRVELYWIMDSGRLSIQKSIFIGDF